jgi:predicted acylesterase/phospholipase RssA
LQIDGDFLYIKSPEELCGRRSQYSTCERGAGYNDDIDPLSVRELQFCFERSRKIEKRDTAPSRNICILSSVIITVTMIKSELVVLLCLLTATERINAFCLEGRHSNVYDSASPLHAMSRPRSQKRCDVPSTSEPRESASWLGKIRLRRHVDSKDTKSSPASTPAPSRRRQQQQQNAISNHGLVEIKTVKELEQYWYGDQQQQQHHDTHGENSNKSSQSRDYLSLLKRLSIVGDTQIIGSKDHPDVVHPVVKVLHERRQKLQERANSEAGSFQGLGGASLNNDGNKVALVIEGGGMRGCVSAGMVCALHHLGLEDTVDVVYGSSAGAVVAAYFCSRQVPWFGPEVYYDQLTTAGEKFIDLKRLLRSLGFGLVDPRLLKDVLMRPENGKPVLNLDYLVGTTMQKAKPLDFEAFRARQKVQPLKIVTTGLKSEQPVVLSQASGHFDTMEDLCSSLHASCLLPGIAGPVVNVLKNLDWKGRSGSRGKRPTFVVGNDHPCIDTDGEEYEPLGDAILSSPIPYDLALKDGATHIVAIRSSPDGHNLMAGTAAKSMWESLIFRRFFLRKNKLPGMFQRLQNFEHQRIYAKSVLELNQAAAVALLTEKEQQRLSHHILTVALQPGSCEVSHLESTREAIFEGVRVGFARAYDALVEDPSMRGRGYKVAKRYFPEEILDYQPEEMTSLSTEEPKKNIKSAFENYMYSNKVHPKAWKGTAMEEAVRHQYETETRIMTTGGICVALSGKS